MVFCKTQVLFYRTQNKQKNMNRERIERICIAKANSLLATNFGELVKEAVVDKPEFIGDYDLELPLRIETEYREFLKDLWKEIAPDDCRSIDDILNNKELREKLTFDDREIITEAHHNALHRTLWERITKTNHRDVTYYKGLLEEYTRELLFCMRHDFMEEIK